MEWRVEQERAQLYSNTLNHLFHSVIYLLADTSTLKEFLFKCSVNLQIKKKKSDAVRSTTWNYFWQFFFLVQFTFRHLHWFASCSFFLKVIKPAWTRRNKCCRSCFVIFYLKSDTTENDHVCLRTFWLTPQNMYGDKHQHLNCRFSGVFAVKCFLNVLFITVGPNLPMKLQMVEQNKSLFQVKPRDVWEVS